MTKLEFTRSDEKATAILKAVRLIDEGVELAPVVHGRWIGPVRVDANNNKYECSECGFWGVPGWAACPKCIAKMDGDSHD